MLLRPVDKHLALLFLLLNLVGVGIQSLSGLNQFGALLLQQRPDYRASSLRISYRPWRCSFSICAKKGS